MSPAGKPGRKFLYYGCGLFRPRVSPAKREHNFFCLGGIQHIRCFFFAPERVQCGSFLYQFWYNITPSIPIWFLSCSHTFPLYVRIPFRSPELLQLQRANQPNWLTFSSSKRDVFFLSVLPRQRGAYSFLLGGIQ